MNKPLMFGILGGLGAFLLASQDAAAQTAGDVLFDVTGLNMGNWINDLNTRGAPYKETILEAERKNGIPPLLLARLLWQESHFRPDIISGQKVSAAGALGIAQIVPKWHPTVNPLDPVAAINYAAGFLRSLYKQFGTWERALQAYNWGSGNLAKYLRGEVSAMPRETSNYSAQILADLGGAGVVA